MAKVLEYALFSQKAYEYKNNSQSAAFFNAWMKQYAWNAASDKIPHAPLPNADFYPEFWIKQDSSEAVIAIRGTANFDNVLTDIKTWYPDIVFNDRNDNLPQHYFRLANVYYHKCLDYLKKNFPKAKLSLTGHSLGGAIAQIVVGLNQRPHTVVAFNAPGIGCMVPQAKNIANLIHNINSRYGMINKIGETVGSIDYIDIPEKEDIAKRYFEADTNEKQEERILQSIQGLVGFEAQAVMSEINADENEKAASILLAGYPQHKISNVIDALKTDQYKTLAYRPYFGAGV